MQASVRRRAVLTFVALGALALGSGCATSRDLMKLEIPQDSAPAASSGKSVFIRTVTDNRRFEENPRDPSTPSLGHGGAGAATEVERKRAIARKRNTYGKALGDILLEEGQTVETVVAGTLKSTFRDMGYAVLNSQNEVQTGTLVLDVSVDRFWAWMNQLGITLTFTADVTTTVSGGRQGVKTISGKGKKLAQTGMSSNWQEAYSRALANFRNEVKVQFAE